MDTAESLGAVSALLPAGVLFDSLDSDDDPDVVLLHPLFR